MGSVRVPNGSAFKIIIVYVTTNSIRAQLKRETFSYILNIKTQVVLTRTALFVFRMLVKGVLSANTVNII